MPTFRNPFTRKDSVRGSTPVDGRLAMAGLVTPAGDLGVTAGVLSGLAVTGRSTAPTWAYSVSAGHAVTTRGASDGASLTGLDGATDTPTVTAAPATGSRWDLIWIRQRDVDNGDPDSDAVLGVTSGTASGSPSKPYGSVPAGALVLAEAQVSAGAANTADPLVTITGVAPRVAARGGVISGTLAQRDFLTTAASPTNPLLFDVAGTVYRSDGTAWTQVARAGALGARFVLRSGNDTVLPTGALPVIQGRAYEAQVPGTGLLTITFQEAFAAPPLVFATVVKGTDSRIAVNNDQITTTTCTLYLPTAAGVQVRVHVLAIGWAP